MSASTFAASALFLAMAAQAQSPQPAGTLAALQDTARPLLIFAGPNDARVEQQYATFVEHVEDARQRDLRIVLLTRSKTKKHDEVQPPQAFLSAEEQQRLRKQFHIAPGAFTVILVGKDGGEKLRSSAPIPWQKLAATVDAMPMRQQEMHPR